MSDRLPVLLTGMSGLAIGHMTPGVIVERYLSRMWGQRQASLPVTFECANVHLVEIMHVLFTQGLSIRRLEVSNR